MFSKEVQISFITLLQEVQMSINLADCITRRRMLMIRGKRKGNDYSCLLHSTFSFVWHRDKPIIARRKGRTGDGGHVSALLSHWEMKQTRNYLNALHLK